MELNDFIKQHAAGQSVAVGLREAAGLTNAEIEDVIATMNTPGFEHLVKVLESRLSAIKDAQFSNVIFFGDHRDAILQGHRIGQLEIIKFIHDLPSSIKREADGRKKLHDTDK